jgi:prepilin-type N-terminal cleavage/methylation domain-containing protein
VNREPGEQIRARRDNVRPLRRAFTLPEVLAALVLIGLVLPAVMKGVSLSMAAADDARKRVEAISLAETKLSEMTAAASSATSSQSAATSGAFGPEWPAFRWEASSQAVETDLTEIRVRVSWTGRGLQRSVELASFAYVPATAGTVTTPAPAAGGGS